MARQPEKQPQSGASNKTPAPVKRVPAPDFISQVKNPQNVGTGYGANGYAGPSSVNPGQMVRSPLAENMKSSSEQGSDPVLDAVIAEGVGAGGVDPLTGDATTMAEGVAGTQVRKIGAGAPPDHPAFVSARARQPSNDWGVSEKIPGALTDDQAQPVRSPGK